jgi:glucose/arabinose dehydrogenase
MSAWVLSVCLAATASAGPSTLPGDFADDPIVTGLDQPVGLALVPDPPSAPGFRMLFVEQRTARVALIVGDSVYTVGTVPGVASVEDERGLLGIAVDARWPGAPYIYIHCTDGRFGNHVAISRFTVTGDLGYTGDGRLQFDSASRYDLMRDLIDFAWNHNGGTVRFGPDGYLYASLGDDAFQCNAPDTTVLAGKILRLDVSRLPAGPGGPAPLALLIPPDNPFVAHPDSGARLVWALGLRNPFRFHFDPATGAMFVCDVGANGWEEVDRVPASGMNMGWPFYEGPAVYSSCAGFTSAGATPPIAYLDHSTGAAVISGGVYHRPPASPAAFPTEYEGNYFFLDYYYGIMRRLVDNGTSWTIATPVPGQPSTLNWGQNFYNVSDVLELPDGTLWYLRQSLSYAPVTGEIRRISYRGVAAAPTAASPLSFAPPVPTPSRGSVKLSWSQPRGATVRLSVRDAAGRTVRVIEDGARFEAGRHDRSWNGRDASGAKAPAGVYFALLEVGGMRRPSRIVLIR